MSLVPTAASKKMMLSQIASKQAENGERAGSPDVLRCSSQVQHLSPLRHLGVGWPKLSARRCPALSPQCFCLGKWERGYSWAVSTLGSSDLPEGFPLLLATAILDCFFLF